MADSRGGFRFRAGSIALDLPATLAGRLKAAQRDLLNGPEDVSRWLVAAGLSPKPPVTETEDVAEMRRLREAIYSLAMAQINGDGMPANARATLNRLAAGPSMAIPRLDSGGKMRVTGSTKGFITLLAHEAIRLFSDDRRARIRQCAFETCALLFLDISRSGERRWCSMSGCGNKAKVAEFRRRKRLAENEASSGGKKSS